MESTSISLSLPAACSFKGLIRLCMEYCSRVWGGGGSTRTALLIRVESKILVSSIQFSSIFKLKVRQFEQMRFGLQGRGTSGSSRTPPGMHTPPGWKVSPPGDTKAQRVAPALLWLLNTTVFGVAPITIVYGTVLSLLVETVPFLTTRCPGLVILLMQVVLVMWLFLRSWDFYILHIKLCVTRGTTPAPPCCSVPNIVQNAEVQWRQPPPTVNCATHALFNGGSIPPFLTHV